MPPAFDPATHGPATTRYFEDFRVGEVFDNPSRTMTEAMFLAFQAVSGDNHPIHYDRHYCARYGHRDLLAHGFQVLAQTAAGAGQLPHQMGASLIGFIEQSSRFRKGVYAGDTLYPRLVISELIGQRTTGVMVCAASVHNHNGELVLDGQHKYLLRRRPKTDAA